MQTAISASGATSRGERRSNSRHSTLGLKSTLKILLVFHPTPLCNLACNYCWAPDKDNALRMPLEVVERAFAQVTENSDLSRIDVCWLTGEPLLMGVDYYKRAVTICNKLKPHSANLRFIVQTNGTLINDEWAEFFAQHDFTVGVTIDGPREIHDAQRMNKAGHSTFEQTSRGIDHLVRHRVKGGALCVITRKTIQSSPDALFEFFRERNLSWSYLLEARIGENASSENALSLDDRPQLRSFLGRLIELWGMHPEQYIRDFDQLARRLFGGGSTRADVDFNNHGCLDILNVMADGDFFWGNPELLSATSKQLREARGSLAQSDVWQFRSSAAFKAMEDATHRGIQKCLDECPYFVGCRGGNPAHKFYTTGRFDASSHLTCELNDQLIAELLVEQVQDSLATQSLARSA